MKLRLIIFSMLIPAAIYAQVQKDSTNFDKEKTTTYSPEKPVFNFDIDQQENKSGYLRYSAHSGYREGIPSIKNSDGTNYGSYIDTAAKTKRVVMVNLSIQDMLTHGIVNPLEVVLEVKDPSKFRYLPEYGDELEWRRKNNWCYEYMQPIESMKDLRLVDEDLSSLFNVSAGRLKRMTNVLVLKRISDKNKLKSSDKQTSLNMETGKITNVNFSEFVNLLRDQLKTLIVDETGYSGSVDMKLGNIDWKDINALRKVLMRYDLSLIKENREVNMFVIREITQDNKTQ